MRTDKKGRDVGNEGNARSAVTIEVADNDVGLALKEHSFYRFVAADQAFYGLDGQRFRSLKALQAAARSYKTR